MPLSLDARLTLRASTLSDIRAFFAGRGVREVTVPNIMPAPVTDPYIEVPRATDPQNRLLGYLQSSPEYAMKRLLAQGSGDIYACAPAFRLDESSPRHRSEFTLLEWYRVAWSGAQLRQEASDLLSQLLDCPDAQEISYRDAFVAELGLCPFSASDSALFALARERLNYPNALTRTQALQWLCAGFVEPNLGRQAPVFLTHYPAEQAALARHVEHQGHPYADRFELFYHGLELANGYWELTDPLEQQARFEADLAQRESEGLPPVPIDQALLAALPQMPACSGIALGLERLMMLRAGVKDIAEVTLF